VWPIAVVLGATLLAFVVFALWQTRLLVASVRRCTDCGGEREDVPPPPDDRRRTYDVMACPQCTGVVTVVSGRPSRFAICPACSRFGLEVEATSLGPNEVGTVPPVEVEERCRICGYADAWSVPDLAVELPDNIIEFPRR